MIVHDILIFLWWLTQPEVCNVASMSEAAVWNAELEFWPFIHETGRANTVPHVKSALINIGLCLANTYIRVVSYNRSKSSVN